MSTKRATPLPERDFLHMEIALAAMQLARPPAPPYRLIFRINLVNTSRTGIKLLGRKWMLSENSGITRIIEAQKLFNERPVLESGSIFSLSGCHDFGTLPTNVELRLFGIDQTNTPFITPPLRFPKRTLKDR